MSSGVKVWYDKNRDCYVSNAAFVLAKQAGCPPYVAAALLADYLKAHSDDVEKVWVS